MPPPDSATLERYARIIRDSLAMDLPFVPVCESASAVQVERGLVLPLALAAREREQLLPIAERLIDLAAADVKAIRVVDRAGHHRPAYRGLLVHAWRRALECVPTDGSPHLDVSREALTRWGLALQHDAERTDWLGPAGVPAAAGAAAAGAAWAALAIAGLGHASAPSACLAALVARQQPSGAFLSPGASDNPETRWYHELVLLHACMTYAVLFRDRPAMDAAMRAAGYHLNETQPDHATSQPWGLLAFICCDAARPLADELLHGVRVRQAAGADGVAQILLADTLLGLQQLVGRGRDQAGSFP